MLVISSGIETKKIAHLAVQAMLFQHPALNFRHVVLLDCHKIKPA
jgi:hypothetical protein